MLMNTPYKNHCSQKTIARDAWAVKMEITDR